MQKLHNKENSQELKEKRLIENIDRITLSFYVYADIIDPFQFRNELFVTLDRLDVCGRIYIATEGVNAQLNVPETNFDEFVDLIRSIPYFEAMRLNIAVDKKAFSFYKLIIKVKDKIVADGLNDETFDATKRGIHLNALEFNELISKPETVLVDMRNHYESEVGHFQDAICPDVDTFRESLPIVEKILEDNKDQPIVMYCTGGIRCEKASAFLKHKGFNDVYQLDGGIIEYAKKAEELGIENKFIGKNFVFDERMGERISDDIIAKCHQCGKPCDRHVNCANDACHILFIQCSSCSSEFDMCCSNKCANFNKLDPESRIKLKKELKFNGTKFGKGRYKAFSANEELDVN